MSRSTPEQVTNICIFCQIIRGERTAQLVYEDEQTLAFLDHRPLLPGHCLVVPKPHIPTLTELPPELIEPLFATVQLIATAVETGLAADGSFIGINNKISQSVPHLHVHVVPRRAKDGLFSRGFVWTRHPYRDEAEAIAIRDAIRSALAHDRHK